MPSSTKSLAAQAAATTVAEIRAAFPALERRHRGTPVAYFDGPGGTQVPRSVVRAMQEYLYQHNANTHWAYPTSQETDSWISGARATLAEFLGAAPAEIAFGANMTTLTFHLARALGRRWGPGDQVVITELDHHANVAPWSALERERGITIRSVPLDPATGRLEWTALERHLEARPRLLAIGAASNALGTITDVAGAVALARSVGTLTFVDAVHFAPHQLVDVQQLGCDFLACSAYKFYGPHVGILFGREEQILSLDVPKLEPAPDTAPERLETGTLNHEGIAGAAAAVRFLASLGPGATTRARLLAAYTELHSRSQLLVHRLWSGLSAISGVRLYGPPPGVSRTPTLSFTVEGAAPERVARALADRAVFVSHGDFYATTAVERLAGKGGLVRAGCACYTTEDEIDRLVEGVRQVRADR